ncbi:hypothetical protein ABZ805_05705 [Saccharopolyspora sp. NPDC047091]|uniref:hypothetical protein n=1 Tax=Saccharopolyspora sp. NPDC047091 TaxID=3155924 RepID=UPI0034070201
MKRSLTTAAAVLAGAGAVGFAGTAHADSQFPAELPVDNGMAQTAFHAAGTVHGAQQTVGDVVRAPQALAEQAGSATGRTGGGNVVGDALQDFTEAHTHPVTTQGAHLPVGGVLPAPQSARSGVTPVDGIAKDQDVRGIVDSVDDFGTSMIGLINSLPADQVNTNTDSQSGQPGKPGTGGENGSNGQPGGSSSAVNTKPAVAGTPKSGLLDLSNAGGVVGKPLADGLAGTPLAGLAGLGQRG